MRPTLAILPAALMLCCPPALADDPAYETSAGWHGSGVAGHTPDSPTYWTTAAGAWAEWRPAFDGPAAAEVFFHRIVWNRDNDPAMRVAIRHAGGTTTRTLTPDGAETGWVSLGVFEFAGEPGEAVRLTRTSAEGITRASAVRFDILGEGERPAVIQSFVLAEPTAGPLVSEELWRPQGPAFTDVPDPLAARAVQALVLRGVIEPDPSARFNPDASATRATFESWLAAAEALLHAPKPAATTENADRSPISARDAASLLSAAARRSARNLDWASDLDALWALPPSGPLTRADAARAVWSFVQQIVEAGPPLGEPWRMVFAEEFDVDALDRSVWNVESGAPGHILSSRWPENVVVDDGSLRLLTRREERGGKTWTTGNVWTKRRFLYGYFEARMKVGAATGLNNAFWLMTDRGQDPDHHFEIDITEARFPNRNAITVHDWHDEHHASGEVHLAPEDLSEDFHVFAARWTPDEIVWYFDGREIRRVRHDYCRAPSPVRLSSAVGRFAGRITEALDGTAQVVDWVRVYEPAPEQQ